MGTCVVQLLVVIEEQIGPIMCDERFFLIDTYAKHFIIHPWIQIMNPDLDKTHSNKSVLFIVQSPPIVMQSMYPYQ